MQMYISGTVTELEVNHMSYYEYFLSADFILFFKYWLSLWSGNSKARIQITQLGSLTLMQN